MALTGFPLMSIMRLGEIEMKVLSREKASPLRLLISFRSSKSSWRYIVVESLSEEMPPCKVYSVKLIAS